MLKLLVVGLQASGDCLSDESSCQLLDLLLTLPHGVEKMSHVMDGLVETSCNLASASLDQNGAGDATYTVRHCCALCMHACNARSTLAVD